MSRITEKEQLFDEMAAFNRKLRSFFDARVAEKGLTLARARTLFALSRRGSLTQKELAEELEIETPTLVRLLDAMEKQKLIERRSDEIDRRAKRIHMTPAGLQTFEDVDAQAKAMRAEIALDISTDEIRVALNVVRRLTGNLQKLSEEEVTP
ncbi:MarR family transcriptional regulator [Agrobacterium tumefaciens]|uniref:MarR family transcriptional regulator n=2 Tax=Rhizobium/Agrobacterium group TaxID=227290 RepID=A0AA92C1B7_RHIRH|nr:MULTISPECIES: MarR family transcriptional regulator [Rhizobium/Agrobacterium group]KQM35168.1 MarR family transcriptional regulator [Rhizobium sp. Leaf202]KQN87902.1 MarR family transcriptional regulator [Rhizobium sp. Leaf68]MDP9570463.1 MarR family transcriptional regulator for hemolysin [Agrobacterium larrymoorei]MQB20446.1 MarR family transcriptional regulator [Agrobacterium tumefaciens]PVE73420.1 MarR family transcriptional regulator [Sphingomonas sp. TPD3009]